MTRDNVERVAQLILRETIGLDWDLANWTAKRRALSAARAAMAATLELAAEDLREHANTVCSVVRDDEWESAIDDAADWLLSRANELKGQTDGE